jgi:predicted DNA-binding transcriptional regulator AlpA
MDQKETILNSWKEIADYLGRGVRTAQRWEHDLALPVRRPRGKERSAVIAVSSDIDAWLKRCPVHYGSSKKQLSPETQTGPRWMITYQNAERLRERTEALYDRALQLRKNLQRALDLSGKLAVQRSLVQESARNGVNGLQKHAPGA